MMLIQNWVQHITSSGGVCTRCGLATIPSEAVLPTGHAYEKSGRYFLNTPAKYEACHAG